MRCGRRRSHDANTYFGLAAIFVGIYHRIVLSSLGQTPPHLRHIEQHGFVGRITKLLRHTDTFSGVLSALVGGRHDSSSPSLPNW
jgi:hypothetical protein